MIHVIFVVFVANIEWRIRKGQIDATIGDFPQALNAITLVNLSKESVDLGHMRFCALRLVLEQFEFITGYH